MSRRIKWLLAASVILAVLCAFAYGVWQYLKPEPVYTGYVILNAAERADSQNAYYAEYGEGFIRYSRDGIAYYNAENVPQWNASYELQTPLLDIRKDYCAVAGIGSSKIYVFNKEGAVVSVDTTLTISAFSVSAKGYVAAILEDGNTQYIDMYDNTGEQVYRIKTSIGGKGIPTDISVSDDAAKLMVAYATVNGGQLDTSIAFYNFGEVGKNETERLVGGFDQYKGMLVPMVQFVNENTAIAVATGKVSIYTISQYPKLVVDITPDQKINSVFCCEDYIGMVFSSHESGHPYVIRVYDMKGNLIGEHAISKSFKEYSFVGRNILMYDDNEVCLINLQGEERYRDTFDTAIDSLIPISGDDIYVWITSRKVQKIQLHE